MVRKRAGLGERHQKILDYLNTFQEKFGYSPSIRQIGKSIGVESTSLVDYYLKQLADMGMIDRDQHVSRSIRLVNAVSADVYRLPLTGRIFASSPIPLPASDVNYFDAESTVEIARSMLPKKENIKDLFALEVQGDSMIDAMVNDGDIVIILEQQDAQNGDIVVALVEDSEATLKRFRRRGSMIALEAANPAYETRVFPDHMVKVQGKLVGLIRSY